MDSRLSDLYKLPQNLTEQDIYLLDLVEHCAHLEEQLRPILDSLSEHDRALLEDYLCTRDELEFQSVRQALKLGKKHSQNRIITSNL